jgi:hypothetical protein
MDADLSFATSAAIKLARMYRVVGDEDIRDVLPEMPRHLRLRALDRLRNDGMLHTRTGGVGFSSAIYAGCD